MINKLLISFFILLLNVRASGQFSLNELKEIGVGKSLDDSKREIISLFKAKPDEILTGDFLGAHQLKYLHYPFSYYGNADVTFQYVQNVLSSIEVSFEFPISDTNNFRRLLKTLNYDFSTPSFDDMKVYQLRMYTNKLWDLIRKNARTFPFDDDTSLNKLNLIRSDPDIWYQNIKSKNGLDDVLYKQMSVGLRAKRFRTIGTRIQDYKSGQSNFPTEIYEFFDQQYIREVYNGSVVFLELLLINQSSISLIERLEKTRIVYMTQTSFEKRIKMKHENGIYKLPVQLNGVLTIDFIFDSGASDVTISPDVFLTLYRSGTITENDFIGTQTYSFADGSRAKSNVFNIKTLVLGGIEINNVRASISSSIEAPLLLGQSALKKLTNYRVDNITSDLVIE
jgi:aspartyl protease family protein